MYYPPSERTLIQLIMHSPLLGIIRYGQIYRLFSFDLLRMDPSSLDIHGDDWGVTFEEFSDNARSFNHEDYSEVMLQYYPESQNQMMLEAVWRGSDGLTPSQIAEYMSLFKAVQYGRIEKE